MMQYAKVRVENAMITVNLLAWKNIRRKMFRSLAIAAGVAAVTGTLFFVTSVMRSVQSSLNRNASRLGADLMVVPMGQRQALQESLSTGKPIAFTMPRLSLVALKKVTLLHRDLKKKIPVIENATVQLFHLAASSGCCDLPGKMLIGFEPDHDFTVTPWLGRGESHVLQPGEVLVGNAIPHQKNYKIQLFNTMFTVAGKLEATGNGYFDEAIFLPLAELQQLIRAASTSENSGQEGLAEELISVILVRTTPLFPVRRVARQIERDVPGTQVILSEEVHTSMGRQMFMLLRGVVLTSAVLWVISFLIIAVIFSMIINERIWEMGVLRAMGANRLTIFRLTISEASILSCAGGIIGIVGGGVVLFTFKGIIENSFALPYQWAQPLQFVLLAFVCLLLGVFTGVCAALLPAARNSLREPAEAIARGQ